MCLYSDGEGKQVKPGKTFSGGGGGGEGKQGEWEVEEKERPREELPATWRIRFSSGMRRTEPHVPLLNQADCPERWPLWVWHSYLKIKS